MNVGKVTLEEGVSGFFESSLWQKRPCGCTTRGFCNTLLFLTSVLSEMGGKSPLPLCLISEVCLGDTARRGRSHCGGCWGESSDLSPAVSTVSQLSSSTLTFSEPGRGGKGMSLRTVTLQ